MCRTTKINYINNIIIRFLYTKKQFKERDTYLIDISNNLFWYLVIINYF